jgi:hypothetical protein
MLPLSGSGAGLEAHDSLNLIEPQGPAKENTNAVSMAKCMDKIISAGGSTRLGRNTGKTPSETFYLPDLSAQETFFNYLAF